MAKTDFKKEWKELYQPSAKQVSEVDVPALTYLMIDGEGDPNTSKEYAAAVEALFTVSYAVKFMVKKGPSSIDYAVMPLEGLWWSDNMADFAKDKSKWKWTMMILQPSFVARKIIDAAMEAVRKKKQLPALSKIRVETLDEGLCAQILHIGPFSAEGPTIERVHQHILSKGRHLCGKHHEIYLSDIRKADPAKWKTVIRQPME
jgi:hypothetical protein